MLKLDKYWCIFIFSTVKYYNARLIKKKLTYVNKIHIKHIYKQYFSLQFYIIKSTEAIHVMCNMTLKKTAQKLNFFQLAFFSFSFSLHKNTKQINTEEIKKKTCTTFLHHSTIFPISSLLYLLYYHLSSDAIHIPTLSKKFLLLCNIILICPLAYHSPSLSPAQ